MLQPQDTLVSTLRHMLKRYPLIRLQWGPVCAYIVDQSRQGTFSAKEHFLDFQKMQVKGSSDSHQSFIYSL